MSTPVDLTRRVRAFRADSERWPDEGPGAMEPRTGLGTEVMGWGYCCPGCGAQSYVPRNLDGDTTGWDLVAGDPREPSTLTLSPSLLCRGCAWHGYLRNGELAPC